MRLLVTFLILALVCGASALWLTAQVTTGSMGGVVTDPQNAAIPGVKVRALHEATGVEFEAVTSEAGLYGFPNLPVGRYTVTVEHPGFKKLVRPGIEIRIAQRQPLDLRLELGEVVETVEVTATPPLLASQTSEVATNFSPTFMNNAPLFTGGIRNPSVFVIYMPGVNTIGDQSINGSPRRGKESLIDGASHTIPESGGVVFDFPSAEQFGEFRLITNSFSAEYGRTGGGIEIFITRSGTNDFHGTGYWNLRRDIFNAAGWSVNQNPRNPPGFRPKERFNEIGGAVGGPVYLPKLYDGRNRSFFFFTYVDDARPASISATTSTVPTARMKRGDFGELPQLIYDPLTTTGAGAAATRAPFPNNIIPAARFSRVSQRLLPLFPDPPLPGILTNLPFVNTSVLDRYMWSIKGDHVIADNNRLSVYFSFEKNDSSAVSFLPGPLGNGLLSYRRPKNLRINHNYIFRPNVILQSTIGFTDLPTGWDNTSQGQKSWGSRLDIPGTDRGLGDAMPRIRFSALDGLTEIGVRDGKTVGSQINQTFHLTQGLSWIRGRHELKFGWDFRRLQTFSDPLDLAWVNGTFDFARDQTAHPQMRGTTGYSFASLLLGLVNRGDVTINAIDPRDSSRYGYQAFYIQDNWKVRPKLMLNIGLRYDVPLARHNPLGQFTSFDPNLPNPKADGLPGALAYAGFGPGRINRKRFADIDWFEFGPRFGLAWQVTEKTVIRGGYGISYSPGNHTTGGFCLGCAFGFTASIEQVSPDGISGAFNWDNGVPPPPGFVPPPFIDPSFANGMSPWYLSPRSGIQPRQHNFSFNIQRELPGNFLFDIAYVGSRAYNLNSSFMLNQVHPRFLVYKELLTQSFDSPAVQALGLRRPFSTFRGTLAQALRPYPQFLDIPDHYGAQGKSWYDSLQVKFEKRFGSYQLYANYTWSKTLSTLSRSQTAFQDWPQDSYNYADEKSLMFWDIPHTVNIIQSFDLPFGRGKKFLPDAPSAVNWLISGWTIASVQQYTSGILVALSAPVAELGAGGLFLPFRKAMLTGQPIKTDLARTELDPNNPNTRWLNPGAVAAPGRYELGTANRYHSAMRNPMRMTENMAVIKRTRLFREGWMFEYRADCFNCFNRTNFGGVIGTLGSPGYGRPTGPQSGPRIITMGLRLTF